jgi:hypothetical protein
VVKKTYWICVMSSKLGRLLIIAAVMVTVSSFCVAQDAPYTYPPYADGIWARGNTIILFARLNECGGPYRPILPLVSKDGGKTWTARGPRLEGSDLEYILDTGAELWIAGEDIAEGPSHDPYVLLYRADAAEWPQILIYDDAAHLLAMARETKTGKLLAWVRHIDFNTEDWTGPVYLHRSVDGGRTWRVVRKVTRVPRSTPGLHFFHGLPRRSGPWRISRRGSAVENLQSDGKWHLVTSLPLPLQQVCSNGEADR